MDGDRARAGEGYASVDGVDKNLGYFHAWLTKSGEVGGAAADGGESSCAAARLRRRRLLVAGAAASLAGVACASLMSGSPGGAAARLPGGWGRSVELQGLGSAAPGPSNQGGCTLALLPCVPRVTRLRNACCVQIPTDAGLSGKCLIAPG